MRELFIFADGTHSYATPGPVAAMRAANDGRTATQRPVPQRWCEWLRRTDRTATQRPVRCCERWVAMMLDPMIYRAPNCPNADGNKYNNGDSLGKMVWIANNLGIYTIPIRYYNGGALFINLQFIFICKTQFIFCFWMIVITPCSTNHPRWINWACYWPDSRDRKHFTVQVQYTSSNCFSLLLVFPLTTSFHSSPIWSHKHW